MVAAHNKESVRLGEGVMPLHEAANLEVSQLHCMLRDLEERTAKNKLDLHSRLASSEAEVSRLRRLLNILASGGAQGLGELDRTSLELAKEADSIPTGSTSGASDPSSKVQLSIRPDSMVPERILSLEAQIHQLTQSLMSKQHAFETAFSENQTLKVSPPN
ncbi:unnamed protein product [Protopolystoma xenopodis]|uniref:Uncharacterized protein n=1 Tax=Protopolystoma xenopodis TaxID=117903 RepID=A0A448X3F1_9PLAT|nr:unnamed protein product [Protopolystoma xenopodis]